MDAYTSRLLSLQPKSYFFAKSARKLLCQALCPVNLHLAREQYRGLAGAAAGRGQCGCRSLRPPQGEACLALRLAFQEAFAKAGRVGSRFVELANSIML